jgi:hypothetical protein
MEIFKVKAGIRRKDETLYQIVEKLRIKGYYSSLILNFSIRVILVDCFAGVCE